MREGGRRRREEADFSPKSRGYPPPHLGVYDFANTLSDSQEHSRELAWRYRFTETERKTIRHGSGIHVSAEEAIPKREGRSQILSPMDRRGVVNAVVGRGDNQPGEGSDVHVEVGVFPKLNEQAQRIADAGFGRAQMKQSDGDYHLRNVINK